MATTTSETEKQLEAAASATTTSVQPKDPNNVADDTEHQLGISVYLTPDHEGFSAVLKARYSDFVVHEVGLDGKVACLESLDPEIPSGDSTKEDTEEAPRKRKREEKEVEATTVGATKKETSWTVLQEELGKFVGEEAAEPVIQFLQKEATIATTKEGEDENDNKDVEVQMFVTLPPIEDKSTRRDVHHWIRSSLESYARSDTADDDKGNKVIRLWPLKYETRMPNYGKFGRNDNGGAQNNRTNKGSKQKKPSGFLQFVLYKENCDTNTAIKQVTRRMGRGRGKHNKVRVGYAGMKDKRGITSQFCTLYQRSPSEIAWVNQNNNNRQGGGNSSKGGVSVVRVGNFQYVSQEMRLGTLKGNRFDVVLRNVRTNKECDQETAKEVLAESAKALRQNGFINYFGMQRFGKFHDTHLCGIAFLQGNFERICDIILQPKEGEQQSAFGGRTKWQDRFSELNGDTPEARSKAEAGCAKRILKCFGRFMANEIAILESLSRYPLDYKRAFSCINKTMRMMFVHAVQSLLWNQVASFRIEKLGHDIIAGDLVFEGGDENNMQDDLKSISSVKVVSDEDIAAKRYRIDDVVVPLLGTKSQRPQNESGKLFDKLLNDNGLTAEMFKKIQDRDISCPGDYRKLICRPSDVDFNIVEYRDPFQPLLQTDLMKLNGVEVLKEEESLSKAEKPLLGMVVGFTLPSSAYATIALRELMKKPTSSEYQKELGLGGSSQV